MHELSDITLIIPSCQRQDFALRSLGYWSGKGPKVHVIDGSEDAVNPRRLESLQTNVQYHHLHAGYYTRLAAAVEMVDTPYACLLGDDEFFLPSGLEASIRTLKQDGSMVACAGRALGFSCHDRRVVGRQVYPRFADYRVDEQTPGERVRAHMGNYTCSTVYAVTRSEVWKDTYRLISGKQYPLFAINELQFEIAVAYAGKSAIVPVLSWMRSFETPPVRGHEPALVEDNNFGTWWVSPERNAERQMFLERFANHIGPDNVEATVEVLRNGFDEYVRYTDEQQIPSTKERVKKARNIVINQTASVLPQILKDVLRPALVRPAQPPGLRQVAEQLAREGCDVNFSELEEITACVAEFHAR